MKFKNGTLVTMEKMHEFYAIHDLFSNAVMTLPDDHEFVFSGRTIEDDLAYFVDTNNWLPVSTSIDIEEAPTFYCRKRLTQLEKDWLAARNIGNNHDYYLSCLRTAIKHLPKGREIIISGFKTGDELFYYSSNNTWLPSRGCNRIETQNDVISRPSIPICEDGYRWIEVDEIIGNNGEYYNHHKEWLKSWSPTRRVHKHQLYRYRRPIEPKPVSVFIIYN